MAETYKWVDDNGRVQYSDHLPPDAAGRGTVELNKQGIVRKVNEPQPTPEQRGALAERLERERQAERLLTERRRQENALLSSYTSEEDIDLAKRRNMALIGAAIASIEARIKAQQRRAVALEREKLFYEKKPVPEKINRDLAAIAQDITKQNALIAQKNEQALAEANRYDDQKARFRELKRQMAQDAQAAGTGRH